MISTPSPLRSTLVRAASSDRADAAGLLRDETTDCDAITPTLPVLKSLCERSLAARTSSDLVPRIIHGLLSATLQNVEDVRSRSGGVAARKLKGNLLAAVLLLTTLPSSVKLSQAAVEHLCFLVAHLMNSTDAVEVRRRCVRLC